MITDEKIEQYIQKIPPAPEALRRTVAFLQEGELTKAAKIAQTDMALSSYLREMVNKPIYGFKNKVEDISQIFGILGVGASQKSVYNYMLGLLSPKKWQLFKLNQNSFRTLQDELGVKWQKILNHLHVEDKNIQSAIALLPSSIIVTEALFCEHIDDVNLLRSTKNLDFNTILQRLCSKDLFDVGEQIAKKWEMPNVIPQIIQASSGVKPNQNKDINMLGKWMHLLLFFELSQPIFIEANLNDFIEFQIEYVSDIYEEFAKIMEIQ